MTSTNLEQIVDAVLYEGYILYPYRSSSKKNHRERFTFGRVYPESYSRALNGAEPCSMQTECLVALSNREASLQVSIRFLQPMAREIGVTSSTVSSGPIFAEQLKTVPELRVGKDVHQSWHEAVERRIDLKPLNLSAASGNHVSEPFHFPALHTLDPIHDGARIVGAIVRRQAVIDGTLELVTQPLDSGLIKVTARVLNQSDVPQIDSNESESVLLQTLASTHTILQVQGAEFISLMDPPIQYRQKVKFCKNIGTWPVLVGDEQTAQKDTLLSSPIILYDYPKIAPESAGPLFDGTEIDEILTLRILTMTEEEKLEMCRVDEHARQLLERTEGLGSNSLLQLHATMRAANAPRPVDSQHQVSSQEIVEPAIAANSVRSNSPSATSIDFDDFFGASTKLERIMIGGTCVQAGSRVRIRPRGRADLLDMAINGQIAIVEAVEQDAEHQIHLAVVLEDDPGRDLGLLRQPGHRFFYGVDEVEPLNPESK